MLHKHAHAFLSHKSSTPKLPLLKTHHQTLCIRPQHVYSIRQNAHASVRVSSRTLTTRSAFQQDADVVPDTNDEYEDNDEDRAVPSATKILVVGAGPIGLLTASYFARRGYNVDVIERQPHPAVRSGEPRRPDHPVVLSSRALLAFRELGMSMSFSSPDASPHRGTYDMATGGKLTPAHPGHPYKATVITSRQRLEEEVAQEARRLYPSLISIKYGAELISADFERRKAVVSMEQGLLGTALQVTQGRTGVGCVMLMETARPAGNASATIEATVPYDLLVGADGADSLVRERMVQAKVKQLHTQRPMRDNERFAPLSHIPQSLSGVSFTSHSTPQADSTDSTEGSSSSTGVNASSSSSSSDALDNNERSSSGAESSSSSSSGGLNSAGVSPVAHIRPEDIQGHSVGEFLYEWRKEGAPTVQLWVSEPGMLAGIVQGTQSWDTATLSTALSSAYGDSLPTQWQEAIVQQASAAASKGLLGRYGATVQTTQFHGTRVLLVGDAAHAMTGELRQGLNCGIEGVRMLNLVVRMSQDNLDRVPMTLSQARGEDAQCMQQLESFQRSMRGNITHGDPLFRIASAIGTLVWRSAFLTVALLRKIWPDKFPDDYIQQQVNDARQGYSETLKIIVRFAAAPVVALLCMIGAFLKLLAANGKIVL